MDCEPESIELSGVDENAMAVAYEEQAIELIKESLAEAEAESDYDSSVTHAFIILGASVSFVDFLLEMLD